jgi:CHAT domain-containing protein
MRSFFRWALPSRLLKFCWLAFAAWLSVCPFHNSVAYSANPPIASAVSQSVAQTEPLSLEQQGRALYETGRFAETVEVLQQVVQNYQRQGDGLHQAIALSNLALTYQRLGAWPQANEAIQRSLTLLTDTASQSVNRTSAIAQVLDIQGQLQLNQGQAEQALTSWQQAAERYSQLNETDRLTKNKINQSRALQTLGFYQQALDLLSERSQALASQPDSLDKVVELRSLGEGLQAVGNLEEAQVRLQESLAIAQQLLANSPGNDSVIEAIALAQLSSGNTARAQQDITAALDWYQQAAATTNSTTTRLQSNLNRLSLLIENAQPTQAQSLIPEIQQQLEALPLSRTAVYARINLANSLSKTTEVSSSLEAATLLSTAVKQSEQLGDRRTQSYALGLLGGLYETTQQWSDAGELTRQALQLATSVNAADVTYLWQWQLGRILRAQSEPGTAQIENLATADLMSNRTEAIALYKQAIKTLQSLRLDIASINPDQQFSFKESVEPAYREEIELLLHPVEGAPNQTDLAAARGALESLQAVELQNFFREACLDVPIAIDRVVEQTEALSGRSTGAIAAVIYPIILADSFEVVLKLPNQNELLYYSTPISQKNVEETLLKLRKQITQPESQRSVEVLSGQVYDWLIRPAEPALKENQVGTLVFVLDGFLKNIPMAALYDGEHYLIETYGIALTPGLELIDPKPIKRQKMRMLFAGLSEAVEDFAPLVAVEQEQAGIAEEVPETTVLLNDSFTAEALETQIEQTPFQVVHLATHGEFSSERQKTFIRSRDRRMTIDELSRILQAQQTQPDPIELLTLSACETAEGDERAALGLAGFAVHSGARSTLASLWSIDDRANAFLMVEFYRQLMQNPLFSKSQALRQAQLELLNHPNYAHPSYWAPYVLLGNWL